MQSIRDNYENDNNYRMCVDNMVDHLHKCHYTPSEMREMAIMACILYEEDKIQLSGIVVPRGCISALKTLEDWMIEEIVE